jgi:hypothetical protein
VSGVDRKRPSGPQSQLQKAAEMTIATGDGAVAFDYLTHQRLDDRKKCGCPYDQLLTRRREGFVPGHNQPPLRIVYAFEFVGVQKQNCELAILIALQNLLLKLPEKQSSVW